MDELGATEPGETSHVNYDNEPRKIPRILRRYKRARLITCARIWRNLLKGKCADFVARILSELGKLTGTAPHSTNALKVFDAVRGQKGFHLETGTLTAFGYAYGSVESGHGKIGVRLAPPGSPSNAFITNSETRTMIHELIHVAPGSGTALYSHQQMAQAAYSAAQALGYKGLRPPGSDFNDRRNSEYFENRLFDACKLK